MDRTYNGFTRTMSKPIYKIWHWEIEKLCIPMSQNPTGIPEYFYVLFGISNHYGGGRPIRTSAIVKVDFEKGIVETKNSIYQLQKGTYELT